MPDNLDAEVERILAMTDAEIVSEAAARGDDIELIAAECRTMFELAAACAALSRARGAE